MLYALGRGGEDRLITTMPHGKEFDRWRARLSQADYQAVIDELESRVEGKTIETASWIPGSDWRGTVFQPVADACNGDMVASGLFFGLLVWRMFMGHPDDWSFGRYDLNGVPIRGLTYFKLER